MGKSDKVGQSKASSDKHPVARYSFRQSTINDRHASDGIANQLDDGNRFKKLLKGLELRRMTRAEKIERWKKDTAAYLNATSEVTPTSSGPQPSTAASLSAPGSRPIASASASASARGPQPSTSEAKNVKIVTFAATLVSPTPEPTKRTSSLSRSNMKRAKKVMSKGARRKLRQQQIEVQRSSSGEDTDTEVEGGAQAQKKRKRPQRKQASPVPLPSPGTSATVQQRPLLSTRASAPTAAPAQSGHKGDDDLPLVEFMGLPQKKKVFILKSATDTVKRVFWTKADVLDDSDSTDCDEHN